MAALSKFYKTVWDSQPHTCYETGVNLYKYHNWHVHHVLEKKYYPQYVFEPNVCVLLSLEQHALWHSIAPSEREAKMPKTWAKYLELKQQYE